MKSSLLVILLLCAPGAWAQDIFTIGVGSESCRQWIAGRSEPEVHITMKQWILGFVSGSNWRGKSQQTRVVDAKSIVAFVDGYCKNNPFHILALAASAAVDDAGGPRSQHKWRR